MFSHANGGTQLYTEQEIENKLLQFLKQNEYSLELISGISEDIILLQKQLLSTFQNQIISPDNDKSIALQIRETLSRAATSFKKEYAPKAYPITSSDKKIRKEMNKLILSCLFETNSLHKLLSHLDNCRVYGTELIAKSKLRNEDGTVTYQLEADSFLKCKMNEFIKNCDPQRDSNSFIELFQTPHQKRK